MFCDFDKVFSPDESWKDVKLNDKNPCAKCDVTKWCDEHMNQIRMSEGFVDEITKRCNGCKAHILWSIDCHKKLKWYEDNDERLKE